MVQRPNIETTVSVLFPSHVVQHYHKDVSPTAGSKATQEGLPLKQGKACLPMVAEVLADCMQQPAPQPCCSICICVLSVRPCKSNSQRITDAHLAAA